MRVCHGICTYKQNKTWCKRIYEKNRRCTLCEVYYDVTTLICPCCKNHTRTRGRSKGLIKGMSIDKPCDLQSTLQKNLSPVSTHLLRIKAIQVEESAI